MRYMIVRTDIRILDPDEMIAAWAQGGRVRDERTEPEPRRQTVCADDRDAALNLARALASVGAVRAGRQRVKVVRIGRAQPEPGFGEGEHAPSSAVRAQPEPGFGEGGHAPRSSVRVQPEPGFGGGGHAPSSAGESEF